MGPEVIASPSSRASLRVGLCLLAAVVVLGMLVVTARALGAIPDWYQGSDEAIIEIDTLHVVKGVSAGSLDSLWLYGPYSRYGWRHPGPLYFYLLAPLYAAGQYNSAALKLGACLINLLALLAVFFVVTRHVDRVPRVVFLVLVCAFAIRSSIALTSVWNPHVVLMPLLASLVLAAAVGSGRPAYLPALAAATSFEAQTSVALVPVALALVVAAIALLYRHLTRDEHLDRAGAWRAARKGIVASALVSLVLWALPLLEQARSPKGNLTRLVEFFSRSDHHGQYARLAWRAWVEHLSLVLRAVPTVPWGHLFQPTSGWASPLLAVAIVFLLYRASRSSWSHAHPLLRSLAVMFLTTALVALWSCLQIEDGITDYDVYWISAVGAGGIATLAALGAAWAIDRWKMPAWRHAAWASRAAVLICIITVGGVGILQFQDQVADAQRRARSMPVVFRLTSSLSVYMQRRDLRRPLIDIRGSWGDAAGVVLHFYRAGDQIAVNNEREFMFGWPLRRTGTEDRVFEIGERNRHDALAARPGDNEVAAYVFTCIHTIEPGGAAAVAPGSQSR